jgi:hypothetical protein
MGNHTVSTAERPIVPDTPDNRRIFRRQLIDELDGWLWDILDKARAGTVKIAHEGERAIFDKDDLTPAFAKGPLVLADLQELDLPGDVMGELVKPLIEVVSTQHALGRKGFRSLRDEMRAWQYAMQRTAMRHGCVAGAFGTVPWDAKFFKENTLDAMIDAERYRVYRGRMQGWLLNLITGTEFGTSIGFPDIVGIGPLTAHQFSFDIPPHRLDDFYNAANIAAALLRAVFPNGDTPYGIEVLPQDMRLEAFLKATTVHGVERTLVGPRWAKSPHDVFAMLVHHAGGHSIFLDADENNPGSAIKAFMSSLFPVARPRFGQRGDNVNIYLEIRPLSGGPTIDQEIAATAFGVGLMYYLADHMDEWKRFGFHHIKSNFFSSGYGLDSELFWQNHGRDFYDSARNIAREMLPHVRKTLIKLCGVDDTEDVLEALAPVERVLITGMTPPKWGKLVRGDLRDHGCTPSQAMETYTRLYLEASQNGTSSAYPANWLNPVPAFV